MGKKSKFLVIALAVLAVLGVAANFLRHHAIPVLQPQGQIGREQRDLMITAFLLMLVVVLPVFIMTFSFAWRYRASNTKAKHTPDWDHSRLLETAWWGIPFAIIAILAVITWNSSHSLDPYKPIASTRPTLNIQVVALQYKWLFIYPQQGIAAVNFVEFPAAAPVHFEITSDAPMNSFWIPQLGGQIYAMPGMSTELNLIADHPGAYRGSSANISGSGFADMDFVARSATTTDFKKWVNSVRQSSTSLDTAAYKQLAKPGMAPLSYYANIEPGLFQAVIMQYMEPGSHL